MSGLTLSQLSRIAPLRVTAWTSTSAMGTGKAETAQALREGRSGLRRNDFAPCELDTWIGRIDGIEQLGFPADFADWDCRNNRVAWLALQQDGLIDAVAAASERYGAHRVAVLIGTSTASIGQTEDAYRVQAAGDAVPDALRPPMTHTLHSTGDFVARALQLAGPCSTVSTACSSSAKVFADAERLLRLGIVDAALVGGVDSLCQSILYGFNSLQLVSQNACRPLDANRDGINLGEAGGFALLERDDAADTASLRLLGYGESSDAHHMSAPHPEGAGAEAAMRDALARAALGGVDYVNLHGTATRKNDAAEAQAIARVFGADQACSSTKAFMGHTLGAAGIVEAVVALQALAQQMVPANLNLEAIDAEIALSPPSKTIDATLNTALTNSFGFGGSNCSLIFGRAA